MDMNHFGGFLRENLGDVTFKEAYDKTKRILNISVSSTGSYERPSLLNYVTSPTVVSGHSLF
jgi:TAG lipase/lysophosphatidylethanolamine acyltransferase